MEESLVCMTADELYVTHAEFQECFIKIWAHFYSKKIADMETRIQNYKDYSIELTHLDLYGNTLYIYICKKYSEIKVYRCHVVCTDLETKTHTIILIDYGEKIVVSYFDVREVIKDNLDQSFINCLSQRAAIQTFLLSDYISKSKSNNELNNILCNKHYTYQSNFVVCGTTFVTLYGIEEKLIDSGLADTIAVATMNTIATSLSSTIALNFKNDIFKGCSITLNTSKCFSLKPQYLDYVNIVDVDITRVSVYNNTLLLTIRTVDSEFENLNNLLNSINRQNLKLKQVLDVYTPCLIVLRKQLVRAIILEVHINSLYIDLVDYGYRHSIPRTAVFEIPPNCSFIEMRSLSVILDKPNDMIVENNMLVQKCFQMMPLKMDHCFGLYKVKLFKKINGNLVDICSLLKDGICTITEEQYSIHRKSPDLFSITEINDEMKGIEDTSMSDKYITSLNGLNSNQIEKLIVNEIDKESLELTEIERINHITITPIVFLRKENLTEDDNEIVCSLICYKSPFNFRVRKHNSQFEYMMDQIKSNLDSRHVLKKYELIKNMYVIYQNQSYFIYRAQVIDMDFDVEKIKLQLVDEGDEIINENFNNITLFNFIENDCNLLAQLVLDCSLSNMWFPVLNIDTVLMLQPYFNKELLYKIQIIKTDESGIKLVQMIQNDTNVDISDAILNSGIGQRLSAAVKTDETPYEEDLLKGQSFLSYVYYYHFKLSIQPEPNTVDELEEEILEHITNNPNPEPMDFNNIQGTYCLATLNDIQWFRAFIKNINEESIIVNMFDIGLLSDVSLKQIRPITSTLMKKPQLCLKCNFETKNLSIKITEKTLYNVTVEKMNANGELFVTIKEHNSAPLSNPIVRGIEEIAYVHIDGDLTYLQRSEDKLRVEKMSEILSKLNGTLECKLSVMPGDVNLFESHGKYYRCVVKSISSKMAVVHCIDFGFEKQVEKKKLQYLGDSKIAMLPALVITVKTFPMAFNMSKTMFLANMPKDKNGTLNAMPNKTSLIHSQNELTESLESGCLVKVTCVYSNNDCWIVPHLFLDRLKVISNTLLKMQSKIIPAVAEIGSLVAALHSKTKIWHRALVLDDENEETDNILSIDSGERFKALKITKLIGEIQKIPNCAIHCQVVSEMDVKTLLNKSVMCKLISSSQPLLKVELFSDNIGKIESTSTQSIMEWTVRVERFESFNEFFVKKINDKYCLNSSNSNSQLNNFTSQPLVDSYAAKMSDFSNDMSSEKIYYHCCLEDDIDDENLIDPKNLGVISNIMMTEWTLKTSSDKEPYIVTLSRDGINCIDILYSIMFYDNIDNHNVPNPTEFSIKETNSMRNIEPDDKYLDSVTEYPKNDIVNKTTLQTLTESPKKAIAYTTGTENDVVLLDVEIVTIKSIDTFQCFYAHSESLSMLYTERINSELDMCIVGLPIDNTLIGFIVVTYSQKFNCWCRAKIEKIKISGISAFCYLLDFGCYEECNEFYKPTNFLCMCPPIVRRCSLYAPQFVGKENEIWFSNLDDMFRDILSIDCIKFDMTIKKNGDPCEVSLRLESAGNAEVIEMLCPIFVEVTYVRSLSDFTIKALSPDQKAVVDQMENININEYQYPMELVESPIVGKMYLAEIKSKYKRVKFEAFGGSKYIVIDVDDTLNALSLDKLYELPEKIRNIPIFTMTCSIINNRNEYMYSLNTFKKYANEKVTFIMCIITESDGKTPNYVKLYLDNMDVLDIIKLTSSKQ